MNLGRHVTIGAQRTPNRIAFEMVDGPAQTYLELERHTNRIASTLLGLGLTVGDRVALWMDNSLEYVDTYLACLKAGLVIVQINIRHTAAEAEYQLRDSGAVAMVFGDAVAERVEQLQLDEQLRVLLCVGVGVGVERVRGALSFADEVERATSDQFVLASGEDRLAVIGYTSGTTGYPKGVELTHRSIHNLGVTNAISNRYALGSHQVFGMSLSFTAATPAHILPHLYVGGTTTFLPEWDTERMVHEIDARKATFFILPSPPILDFIEAARAVGSSIPSVVSVLHSASKAPPEHLEAFVDAFGPRLLEGWGMTENSGGLVAATSVADYTDRRPGIFETAGRAVPDTQVMLIDEDGNPLPEDGQAVGQLLAKSTALARGYWKNPEATARTFADGWYHSGDLGTIDPDGYITIFDRRNDLIVSGGMNVYPSEIERVILSFDGVMEVAVVPGVHERWGQTPIAHIVAKSTVDEAALMQYCKQQLAGYKLPTRFVQTDELPKNASGKVLRQQLRDAVL